MIEVYNGIIINCPLSNVLLPNTLCLLSYSFLWLLLISITLKCICFLIFPDLFILAIPLDEARQSECVAIVQTSHGGHIGFLEGLFPRHRSFMDRMFAEYVFAVFENLNALKEIFNH